MSLTPDAVASLTAGTLADLGRLLPELALVGTLLALLLLRMLTARPLGLVAVAGSVAAFVLLLAPTSPGPAFTGLLLLDPLAGYVRGVVLLATALVVLLCELTGEPAGDPADRHTLLLGSALGLCLMASANHLLVLFLAVEMASLPGYVLAGFRRGDRAGAEAALKYVVYGAAASGVMLFGLTLLVGASGTATLAAVRGDSLPTAAGLGLMGLGLAFKLAAVPAHVWLPDVLSGASAEVGAFLSVASKAAAVGVVARLLPLLPPESGGVLAGVAAVTVTWGNLAALAQTDLRRLLAYSTVAHAGYLLMGLACRTPAGTSASLFYLGAYLLMNLLAFAGAAVLHRHAGGATLAECRGLVRRSPAVAVAVGVGLLSLLGLPPLAGFAGKFQVFAAVYDAGYGWLLVVGLANTVLSAGYYLRVLRALLLDDPPALDEKGRPLPLGEGFGVRLYLLALAAGLVGVGVAWGPLAGLAAGAGR